jgi:hypothetical protein
MLVVRPIRSRQMLFRIFFGRDESPRHGQHRKHNEGGRSISDYFVQLHILLLLIVRRPILPLAWTQHPQPRFLHTSSFRRGSAWPNTSHLVPDCIQRVSHSRRSYILLWAIYSLQPARRTRLGPLLRNDRRNQATEDRRLASRTTPEYGFTFIPRDHERRSLILTNRHPYITAPQSFDSFDGTTQPPEHFRRHGVSRSLMKV